MSTLKTLPSNDSAEDFINTVADETRKQDSFTLLELFKKVTGEQPRMWGSSIIGFGMYHYKSERSAQEGDWPLVGFSPRKQNLTLYVMPGSDELDGALQKLGKHKTSKGCLYINKLADVDMPALKDVVTLAYKLAKKQHNQ